MRRWITVLMLTLSLPAAGCTANLGQPPASQPARETSAVSAVKMTAQEAVDAVFTKVGSDATYGQFPRSIGSQSGELSVGGPPPGQTIPAIYETKVTQLDDGAYEVRLIRRWGRDFDFGTTWIFRVEPTGIVRDPVQVGDEPPHVP